MPRFRPMLARSARLAFRALLLAVLFLPVRPTVSPAADPDGAWQRMDQGILSGRRAAAAAYDSHRHQLVVFGGYPEFLGDVWTQDLATGRWTPLSPSGGGPSPRYGASAIYDSANQRLIVFGGFDGLVESNQVWALSLNGPHAWTLLAPAGAPPEGRSFHVAIYDAPRGRMVMVGGWNGTSFRGDTWTLSLSGAPAWTPLAFVETPAHRDLASAIYDPVRQQMVMFGGWNGVYLNDTWRLSLAGTPVWTQLFTAQSPFGRREISAAYDPVNDAMFLFGGNAGWPQKDAWSLSLGGTPNWNGVLMAGSEPEHRYGHSTVYDPVRSRMVVFGGNTEGGHSADSWALRLDGSGRWDALHLPPIRNYSLVLDPVARDVLMFGGEREVPTHLSDQLFTFDLDAGADWRQVSANAPIPSPRYAQRAAWDPVRDRMLMFGGYDGVYLNDLWEYRPRPSPAWAPLFPSGPPPSPRFAGGVVFDAPRDRLLAFGGYSDVASYNDLWELPLSGPGAMAWNPLAPTGAPPGVRWGFTMHHDASRDRVIVFAGGDDVTAPTRQLFTLDLAAKPPAWSEVSPLSNAVSTRIIHASVLDAPRDRLVVFGGFSGAFFLNDVWAIELSDLAHWVPLSPAGLAPAPRDAIGAVFDAASGRMIVPAGFGPGRNHRDTWALHWDQPTAAAASLISSHALADRVELHWHVRDAGGVEITVERRPEAGEWQERARADRSGDERVSYTDLGVEAGRTYGYRLRFRDASGTTHTEETLIAVPSGFRLELAGAQPNPGGADGLGVAFSLARRGSARLELLDVAGRRVAARDLGGFEPGRHRIMFGDSMRLEPGVYLIRLTAEGRVLTAKALVVR